MRAPAHLRGLPVNHVDEPTGEYGSIEHLWDAVRDKASTSRERAEIDAIFYRHQVETTSL